MLFGERPSCVATSMLVLPSTTSLSTSTSRALSRSSGSSRPPGASAPQRDAVAEVALTGVDHAHGRGDFVPGRFLEQVAVRAGPQRLLHVLHLGMHGKHQQAGARRDRAQPARDIDPADAGHGDVEDRDVGLFARGEAHRGVAVGKGRDHAHVGLLFEEPAHAFAHQRVVVDSMTRIIGRNDKTRADRPPSGERQKVAKIRSTPVRLRTHSRERGVWKLSGP